MPEAVVHLLEVIEIDPDNRQVGPHLATLGEREIEGASVRQAGQRILVGLPLDLVMRLAQRQPALDRLGDVGRYCHEPEGRAVGILQQRDPEADPVGAPGLGVVQDLDIDFLALRQRGSDPGDRIGIGVRPLQEGTGLPAFDLAHDIAGQTLEGRVDPSDSAVETGNDDGFLGALGDGGQLAELLLLLLKRCLGRLQRLVGAQDALAARGGQEQQGDRHRDRDEERVLPRQRAAQKEPLRGVRLEDEVQAGSIQPREECSVARGRRGPGLVAGDEAERAERLVLALQRDDLFQIDDGQHGALEISLVEDRLEDEEILMVAEDMRRR